MGDGIQLGKVAVVKAPTSSQLPDSLDGIEFGAVRREEVEAEMFGARLPPGSVEAGMVIAGVVGDHDGSAPTTAGGVPQLAQERMTRDGIKGAFLAPEHKPAVADPDGSEVFDALAGRVVKKHGVLHFRGNPHTAPGTVLLEVNFVHGP